jgi:hypothetical protein
MLALGFLFDRPTAAVTVAEGGAGDSTVICDSAIRSGYADGRALR